jgi:hypothetical protein
MEFITAHHSDVLFITNAALCAMFLYLLLWSRNSGYRHENISKLWRLALISAFIAILETVKERSWASDIAFSVFASSCILNLYLLIREIVRYKRSLQPLQSLLNRTDSLVSRLNRQAQAVSIGSQSGWRGFSGISGVSGSAGVSGLSGHSGHWGESGHTGESGLRLIQEEYEQNLQNLGWHAINDKAVKAGIGVESKKEISLTKFDLMLTEGTENGPGN